VSQTNRQTNTKHNLRGIGKMWKMKIHVMHKEIQYKPSSLTAA